MNENAIDGPLMDMYDKFHCDITGHFPISSLFIGQQLPNGWRVTERFADGRVAIDRVTEMGSKRRTYAEWETVTVRELERR